MLYTLCAAPRAVAKVCKLGEVCPTANAPMSTTKNTLREGHISVSGIFFRVSSCLNKFCHNVPTHSEYNSDGVLLTQDECTSIPEGQSIGQVDHQEGEAHGEVSRGRLPCSHALCILQVLIISVGKHTETSMSASAQ